MIKEMNNRNKIYEKIYLANVNTQISEYIDEFIFLNVCRGDSLHNWDENYWCIREQIYCEKKKMI